MVFKNYYIIVFAMALVSFLPRWIPLFFLSRKKLPLIIEEWLDFIPVAILSALLAPYLLTKGEPRILSFVKPEFLVAFPTFLIAFLTRSLGLSLLAGMFFFWLAESYLPF